MAFPAFAITALGLDMQAQAELGGTLTFTRIALGAGSAANPSAATAMVDQRMTSNIQEFVNMGGGNVRLRAVFSNLALAVGFSMTEVGVFALDPTTGTERLHSYTRTTLPSYPPDYMPPSSGPTILEQIFDAIITIGSAANVTAVIDNTVMIATKQDTLFQVIPKVTIGAGGAAAVDLSCASAGYDEVTVLFSNLFRQSTKAYLQADSADGFQEIIERGASAPVMSQFSRVWLSRALPAPMIIGSATGTASTSRLAVSGNYAYVTGESVNSLYVIDVSNPTSPSVVATLTGFSSPNGVVVSGNYAYVINRSGNTLSVVDISTPTSPSIVGTATGLNNPNGVAVSGSYAYVSNGTGNTMSVINVSNPAAPAVVGTATGLSGNSSVAVSGSYAYVTNSTGNTLSVINVATPASPSVVGTLSGLNAPGSVAVSGSYAYVVNTGNNTLSVINVATPASPSVVGTLSAGLNAPNRVTVSGSYAYVSNNGANTISVVDVSTPASPVIVGTATGFTGPYAVAVSGNYAYVTGTNSIMSIVDISTASGGRLALWRGESGGMQYEMTMVSASGRSSFRASGRLPSWAIRLTVNSLLTGGLLEGGTIIVRGRRAAP